MKERKKAINTKNTSSKYTANRAEGMREEKNTTKKTTT